MATGLNYTVNALIHCTCKLYSYSAHCACQALLIRPAAPAISLWLNADNVVTLMYTTGQYRAGKCSANQFSALHFTEVQYTAVQCSAV